MKHLSLILILSALLLTACGKREEAPPATTGIAAPESEAVPATGSKAVAEVEKVAQQVKDVVVKQIDWPNLTWDTVSTVPYQNKDQLVDWAGGQVGAWKDKLAAAVGSPEAQSALKTGAKNLMSMAGAGDYEKYLDPVISAIEQVKTSNPETYAMARDLLVSNWKKFETEALKLLGQG